MPQVDMNLSILALSVILAPSTVYQQYHALDRAYDNRAVAAVGKLLSPDYVDTTGDKPRGKRQFLEDTKGLFRSLASARFRSRIISVSREGNRVVAIVSREGTLTLKTPIQWQPNPVHKYSVSVETWQRTPACWILVRRSPSAFQSQISRLVSIDQEVRQRFLQNMQDPKTQAEMVQIDRQNLAALKSLLRVHGWPKASRVGTDTAHNVWLLVQHAREDRPLQRECLRQMEIALREGDADPSDVAYLTDDLLIADGKPQRYGSGLVTGPDGVLDFRPIEDPPNLDARRKAVGLPPIAEYKKLIESTYKGSVRWRRTTK